MVRRKGTKNKPIPSLEQLLDMPGEWFTIMEFMASKPSIREDDWQKLEKAFKEVPDGEVKVIGGLSSLAIYRERKITKLLQTVLLQATKRLWSDASEEFQRLVFQLAEVYAHLFVFSGLADEALLSTFINHIKFRIKNSDISKKEYKRPLLSEEIRQLYQKESLRTKEIAKLFGVRPRQIQRWVKERKLKKRGPGGTFLRNDYLKFAQNSLKYGDVQFAYNKISQERKRR